MFRYLLGRGILWFATVGGGGGGGVGGGGGGGDGDGGGSSGAAKQEGQSNLRRLEAWFEPPSVLLCVTRTSEPAAPLGADTGRPGGDHGAGGDDATGASGVFLLAASDDLATSDDLAASGLCRPIAQP